MLSAAAPLLFFDGRAGFGVCVDPFAGLFVRGIVASVKINITPVAPSRSRSHFAARASRSGNVRLEHVIGDHAIGAEPPAERTDRVLHSGNPLPRQSVAVAVVVQRDDFVAQRFHQRLCVSPRPIAKPLWPSYASAHHPSRMDRFRPPFSTTFCPLVPEASSGRRGVLSHTSTPCTR